MKEDTALPEPAQVPEQTPEQTPARTNAADRSLVDDLRHLVDDARVLAETELAFQQARASFTANGAKAVAVLVGLAAALAFFALMALALGLVLALAPLLTVWGATAAVVGGLLLTGLLCLLAAKARWRSMSRALSEREP